MDCTCDPDYLLLNTYEIYITFYKYASKIFKNELDIIELVNQAIDYATNDIYLEYPKVDYIVFDLLRQRSLTENDTLYINMLFSKLCRNLMGVLKELNLPPMSRNTFNDKDVYPYYFYKIINNRIILKHF